MCHLSIGSNSSTNSREKMALIAAVDRLFLLWPFHWNRIQFSLFSVLFSSFLFRILVQHSLVVILFDLLIPLVINVRMHAKCINFIFLASHKSIRIENGVFWSSFAIFSTIFGGTFLEADREPACRPSCTIIFFIIYVICCGQYDLCLHFCIGRKMRVARKNA